jgi:hypothetical protein
MARRPQHEMTFKGTVSKTIDELERLAEDPDPGVSGIASACAARLSNLYDAYVLMGVRVNELERLLVRDLNKLAVRGYSKKKLIEVQAYVTGARSAFNDAITQGALEATVLQQCDAVRTLVDAYIQGAKKKKK